MAKKRKSAYERERNRILSAYRRESKKYGIKSNVYIPTLKEIKSEGFKGSSITRFTNDLKKITTKQVKQNVKSALPRFYQVVVDNTISYIDEANSGLGKQLSVAKWAILSAVDRHGVEIVGKALVEVPIEIIESLLNTVPSDRVGQEYSAMFTAALGSILSEEENKKVEEIFG